MPRPAVVVMRPVLVRRPTWVVAILLVAASVAAAAPVDIVVRDAVTGAPLDASLELIPVAAAGDVSALDLQRRVEVRGGRRRVEIDAPQRARLTAAGHLSLGTVIEPGSSGWTLWLQPRDGHEEIAPVDGRMVIEGVVRDAVTLQPVERAELRLQPGGATAWSDAGGRYRLEVDIADPPGAAKFLQLEVRSGGAAVLVDQSIPAVVGTLRRNLDIGAGVGAQVLHRHQLPAREAIQIEDGRWRAVPTGSDPDQPPASVRVGFADASCTQACCTASCTHTCVFDLETYVRRGITYEWIGSWTQHSLRAGTIAYRSYGAWHALNPVAGRPFDLCSSACCQVNGPNVISAGTQAARATAGIMLKRNDAVFRSEYSAENNCLLGELSCSNSDLSCGNGFNGSPSLGWPCLQDDVGFNRACFGHGRGMSQWGTQRWSQSPHLRQWPWIVNQYYNAHGAGSGMRTAVMTRVLGILDAAASPATVLPGQTFQVVVEALNRAAESHQAVLVGASIRRGSDPFISDPANDQPVQLEPGVGLALRHFVVPSDAQPGRYALWVSLYIDVDGDGLLTGSDMVQALVQMPDALQVLDNEHRIFADGFES